jgi:hypothetical protein
MRLPDRDPEAGHTFRYSEEKVKPDF